MGRSNSRLLRRLLKWHDRTAIFFEGVTSLEGPVESIDGKFILRIPLSAGGSRLRRCARGISYVDRDFLNVVIPDWLAEKLSISGGSIVAVDNRDGRFNIRLSQPTSGSPTT